MSKEMKTACIKIVSKALGRPITPEESAEMMSGIRKGMERAKWMMDKGKSESEFDNLSVDEKIQKGMEYYFSEKERQALNRKRMAVLRVEKQLKQVDDLNRRRDQGRPAFKALGDMLVDLDKKAKANVSQYLSEFYAAVDALPKNILGEVPKRIERDIARVMKGEETQVLDKVVAENIALIYKKIQEALVDRFNKAGGDMGLLEDRLPQTHNAGRMADAANLINKVPLKARLKKDLENFKKGKSTKMENETAWVRFIVPRLDRSKYLNDMGEVMDDNEIRALFHHIYEDIISNDSVDINERSLEGANQVNAGKSRVEMRSKSRVIHFKDADSFMDYHEIFGSGSLVTSIFSDINGFAKDVTMIEEFGPNPTNTFNALHSLAEAEGNKFRLLEMGKTVVSPTKGRADAYGFSLVNTKAMWMELNGESNQVVPGRDRLANGAQALRNIEVFARLGATLISSVTDIGTYAINARFNRAPAMKASMRLLKAFANDPESNILAVRAGIIADELTSSVARYGSDLIGENITSKLADATMKLSGLDRFTHGIRRASAINTMGFMSNAVSNYAWKDLPKAIRTRFEVTGFDRQKWNLLRKAKPTDCRGEKFLTLADLKDTVKRYREAPAMDADGKPILSLDGKPLTVIGAMREAKKNRFEYATHLRATLAGKPSEKGLATFGEIDIDSLNNKQLSAIKQKLARGKPLDKKDLATLNNATNGIAKSAFPDPKYSPEITKELDVYERLANYNENDLYTTYQSFVMDEGAIASLDPDLATRATRHFGLKRGSIEGEILRSLMLFKSFPIGFVNKHIARGRLYAQMYGNGAATAYYATIITTMTLLGAVALQLDSLRQGKDFENMGSSNFWLRAFAKGGGAGFMSDIIASGLDGRSAYGAPNMIKMMGPVAGSMLEAYDVGKSYLTQGAYDKETNANAKALRFIEGHLPFVNLWYVSGALDRLVYNDMMEMASPGYNAKMRKRALKNYGTQYWWKPNRMTPSRAPKVGRVPNK